MPRYEQRDLIELRKHTFTAYCGKCNRFERQIYCRLVRRSYCFGCYGRHLDSRSKNKNLFTDAAGT